jgi:hypothetical protein
VLLLGEKHTTAGVGTDAEDARQDVHRWLEDLAFEAPECLDVLVESPYGPGHPDPALPVERLERYKFPLIAVEHAFYSCRDTDLERQERCFSQRLRYHRLNSHEIRDNWAMTQLFFAYDEDVFSKAGLAIQGDYWARRRVLYDFLIGKDTGAEARQLFEQYLAELVRETFILGHDDPRDVAFEVARYMDLYRVFMPSYRRWVDEGLARCPALDRKRFEDVYGDVCMSQPEIAPVMWTIPMDVGCFLELFSRKGEAERRKGPAGCSEGRFAEKRNVIILSGASHTVRYGEFLERYFGARAWNFSSPDIDQQRIVFEPPFDFFGPRAPE